MEPPKTSHNHPKPPTTTYTGMASTEMPECRNTQIRNGGILKPENKITKTPNIKLLKPGTHKNS